MKWAILTLISIFICVCCAQMLEWDASGNLIAHSFSIWGDWSAHFTFISNLLNRGPHWLSGDNPAFYGMPFQYPFLSHLFTASIAWITRMDVAHTTYFTSLILLFALPFVLFHFFKALALTQRQSILSTLLFLFLGGFQAFDSSLSNAEPFTNQFKQGSVFTQIVLFELFPQRAFLFGLIALLAGLSFALRKIQSQKFTRVHFFGLSFFFALLAWTHIHSWIALGTILVIYFIFSLISKLKSPTPSKNLTLQILYFGLTVLMVSAPLLYFLLLRKNSEHPIPLANAQGWQIWYPGWAQNSSSGLSGAQEMNPIFFWLYNTALFLPLASLGKLLLWKRDTPILSSPIFILATAGSMLFIVAELINIQPYFYDNLKLFTYAFLFITPFASVGLDALFEKKYLIPIGLVALGVQMYTATSDYLFFKNNGQTVEFLSRDEMDLAEQFRSLRRSPDSLVLISPKHNHWLPTLAGNPIFMGYPGWLWTWGISYGEREKEVNEVLSGGPRASEILSKYPIEYIAVNDQDRVGQAPISMSFLRGHTSVLIEQGSWHVFTVHH